MPPSSTHPASQASDRRRVAVVIPVHNHEAFVEAAIASVLQQSRPPDRLLIVDDGSSDGSVAAVERAIGAAGEIHVELRVQSNRGSARTLNEAIASLDEEFVGILNSDDLWALDRLERLLPHLERSGPSLAFSGVEFFGDSSQPDLAVYPAWMNDAFNLGRRFPTAGFSLLLANIAVSTGNLLFARELHREVGGFDESLPISHDWQFLLDALRLAEPVFVPDPLYRYRIHARNTYREHADPSRNELRMLHSAFMGWATARSSNPLAPTPRNFPRWTPFFVPIWLRMVPGSNRSVPQSLMQLAPRHRDGLDAVPESLERGSIAGVLERLRNNADTPPPLEVVRHEAARHWAEVREASPPLRPIPSAAGVSARFRWAGGTTTVTAADPEELVELCDFTGLEPEPISLRLGRGELNLLADPQIFVHGQHRLYPRREERMIWAALTVGEFLARDAKCPLLHAAAIECGGVVALLCGPPFAGKSTTTLSALARGLVVLGDDQVRVIEGASAVQALPRPVKLRLDLDAPLPAGVSGSDRPLRGWLEEEQTLMLRRGSASSPEAIRPVGAIFHLSRCSGPTCTLAEIDRAPARELLAPQRRGRAAEDPDSIDREYAGLLSVPHFSLSVGEHRTDAALDLVEEMLESHVERTRGDLGSSPEDRS